MIHKKEFYMDINEQIVLDWIEKNYDLTTIDIIDYIMPYSKIIRNREAKEILVYWDFVKKQIIESAF
jgi:hypothetical protein